MPELPPPTSPFYVLADLVRAGNLRTPDGRRPGVTLAQFRELYPACRWTDQHWGKVLRGEGWSLHVTMIKGRRLHYWLPAGMAPQQQGRPCADGLPQSPGREPGVPSPRTRVSVVVNPSTGETRMIFRRGSRIVDVDPAHREAVRARWRPKQIEYELTDPARCSY
jgi:hypothetical protein